MASSSICWNLLDHGMSGLPAEWSPLFLTAWSLLEHARSMAAALRRLATCLYDTIARDTCHENGDRTSICRDGSRATRGTVDPGLLTRLTSHPYSRGLKRYEWIICLSHSTLRRRLSFLDLLLVLLLPVDMHSVDQVARRQQNKTSTKEDGSPALSIGTSIGWRRRSPRGFLSSASICYEKLYCMILVPLAATMRSLSHSRSRFRVRDSTCTRKLTKLIMVRVRVRRRLPESFALLSRA